MKVTLELESWELRHIIDAVSHRRRSQESRLAKQSANGTVYQPPPGHKNVLVSAITDMKNIERKMREAMGVES